MDYLRGPHWQPGDSGARHLPGRPVAFEPLWTGAGTAASACREGDPRRPHGTVRRERSSCYTTALVRGHLVFGQHFREPTRNPIDLKTRGAILLAALLVSSACSTTQYYLKPAASDVQDVFYVSGIPAVSEVLYFAEDEFLYVGVRGHTNSELLVLQLYVANETHDSLDVLPDEIEVLGTSAIIGPHCEYGAPSITFATSKPSKPRLASSTRLPAGSKQLTPAVLPRDRPACIPTPTASHSDPTAGHPRPTTTARSPKLNRGTQPSAEPCWTLSGADYRFWMFIFSNVQRSFRGTTSSVWFLSSGNCTTGIGFGYRLTIGR